MNRRICQSNQFILEWQIYYSSLYRISCQQQMQLSHSKLCWESAPHAFQNQIFNHLWCVLSQHGNGIDLRWIENQHWNSLMLMRKANWSIMFFVFHLYLLRILLLCCSYTNILFHSRYLDNFFEIHFEF